jgi:hypothetical protein
MGLLILSSFFRGVSDICIQEKAPAAFQMLDQIFQLCMGNVMFENPADLTIIVQGDNVNKHILPFLVDTEPEG